MKVTAVEELVIRRKRRYYWHNTSDRYWLGRLLQEIIELIATLLGVHKHAASRELEQIAGICIHWIEKRAKI